jgi:hypothetical protein
LWIRNSWRCDHRSLLVLVLMLVLRLHLVMWWPAWWYLGCLVETRWTLHADWDPLTSGLVWITTLLLTGLAKLVEERLVKE